MSKRHTIDSVRGPFESCAARQTAPARGPSIIVSFYYDVDSPFRFHRDCAGVESWIGRSERSDAFDPPEDTVNDLIRHKIIFGATTASGAFSSPRREEHADTEVLEEVVGAGLDDADDDDDEFAGPIPFF